MLNKLDGKVIVDRDLIEYFGEILSEIYGPRRDAINSALDTDLTGWTAVPVEPTSKMDDDGYLAIKAEIIINDCPRECYRAMLNASPPLPGTTGE